MPRVNVVKRAQKDYPAHGIKKGQTYYWWEFRYGGKRMSATRPRPSQLTQSEFLSAWRGFSEQIDDLPLDDGLYDALQEIASEIRQLGEEQTDKRDNMPEGLQQGSTGEMLEQRANNAEEWASAIEALEDPGDLEDDTDDAAKEEYQEKLEALRDEARDSDPGEV